MSGKEGLDFLRRNQREEKPRRRGLTEVRGSYYTVAGRRYLKDLFEAAGAHIDSLKYAGGSFALMPPKIVRELNELCHRYDIAVSTGGFIEYVLTQGSEAVDRYVEACADFGFDIIEISATAPNERRWIRPQCATAEKGFGGAASCRRSQW